MGPPDQLLTPSERLARLGAACALDDALALFDALPAVRVDEVTGSWAGRELATGHRLDGLLTASGWRGKRFDAVDEVHPLVFATAGGSTFAAEPRRMPLALAGLVPPALVARARALLPLLAPLIRTRRPRARLRQVEYRGVVSAAMVYDHLPIIDIFRRVDADTLLCVMDLRGDPWPFCFVLTRER